MKKSEMYRIAQLAVLADDSIPNEQKLQVLSLLMGNEVLASFVESEEEKK